MILLGAVCGIVFYYMFMFTGGLLILHCVSVGIFYGLLNSFTALFFIKKYTIVKSDNKRLEQQIRMDKLTQLYNRHAFDNDIKNKNLNSEATYSMIFLDIDNFRSFNNKYGHPAGDKILSNCANIIKNNIRTSDMPYRYGGEEIVIMLDSCPKKEAERIAQNIIEAICSHDNAPYPQVTVSAGIASIPDDAETIDQLIKNSDLALMKAKKEGKNMVVNYNSN